MSDEQVQPTEPKSPIGFSTDQPNTEVDFDTSNISEHSINDVMREIGRDTEEGVGNSGYKEEQRYAQAFSIDGSTMQDVVSGIMHKTINYYGQKEHSGVTFFEHIAPEDIQRLKNIYVPPQSYEEAMRLLKERRLLILWGDYAIGKATTALHLLYEHSSSVLHIDPKTNPEHLKEFEFAPEKGYVIDTFDAACALQFDSFLLEKLSHQLHAAQSYLVITVDSLVTLKRDALRTYLMAWESRPDMSQMLHRHLHNHIEPNAEELRGRASQLLTDSRIAYALRNNPPLYTIAKLAELLHRVVNDRLSLDAALQQHNAATFEQIDHWFRAPGRTMDDQALMISLAVFSGTRQQIVREAERLLLDLWRPKQDEITGSTFQPVFTSWPDRLHTVGAHQKSSTERTSVGEVKVPIVQFDNDYYQAAVLAYVWHNYDGMNDRLLTWLGALGAHSDGDVRGYAAAAIGYLARHDIQTTVNKVILPWAMHEQRQFRAAAALALGVLASDEQYIINVLALLENWSKSKSSIWLKLTAVMAYGSFIGRLRPATAFQRLSQITLTQMVDKRLLYQVIDSTTALFQYRRDDPQHVLQVVEALVIWTNEPGPRFTIWCGLTAFLRMTKSRVRAIPDDGRWPALLWLCEENEECRKRIIILWRRALNNSLTESYALHTALYRWFRAVHNDTRLLNTFKKLLRRLARGDQDNTDRIEMWLKELIENDDEYTSTARALFATLFE